MSAFIQRAFLQAENVLLQSRRFRGKINIQRPRPPHYERALFNAVTQPVYPRRTAIEICQTKREEQRILREQTSNLPLHPYERILARELFEFFNGAQMILICQKNSMNAYEFFKFRVACKEQNALCKVYGRKIITNAISGTKFEPMNALLRQTAHNCMLFGNDWNVSEMLKVLRKHPKIILLAGALGDRYMSRTELENFAKLPDITTARAQFVATLNSVGSQLTNHLQAHQSNLCYLLDAHADILKSANTSKTDDQSNDAVKEKTE